MAERIRVHKAIARSGLMSRRAAEEAMAAGRVRVDGRTVTPGDKVDPVAEVVTLDEVPIPLDPGLETHLLYKPVGVIATASDPRARSTVVDLIDTDKRVYPVGRLDADSEGLILLTNDGELTNRVTHPRYGITKTYLAVIDDSVARAAVKALEEGVMLDDGPAEAVAARIVERGSRQTMIELVMGEGRNREIRRMFGALGYTVSRLVRTAIGPLVDRDLQPGESRLVTAQEIRRLLESGSSRP